MKLVGYVASMGERMDEYGISMGRPDGKRQLGRLSYRWDSNIKMYFRKSDRDMEWIGLPQGRNRWRAGVYAITNRSPP